MLPVIRVGSLELSTSWMMLGIGSLGMLMYALYIRKEYSLAVWRCVLFAFVLTVVGVLGAKLLYVLENIRHTLENGISFGGVSFFGSVFLIPLLMPLTGKMFRLKPGAVMDLCQKRRGIYVNLEYFDDTRMVATYELPLAEIVYNFFDKLKSFTKENVHLR